MEEECRVQGGESVMAWAMIVDGVVSVYWHPPGTCVDQHVYLMLEDAAGVHAAQDRGPRAS